MWQDCMPLEACVYSKPLFEVPAPIDPTNGFRPATPQIQGEVISIRCRLLEHAVARNTKYAKISERVFVESFHINQEPSAKLG
jgi:hypothetical protein